MPSTAQTPTGIPGGAIGVEYLRGQMAALDTDTERHVFAIRNFETNVGFGVDVEMSRFCIQACRDFVQRRVPCVRDDDAYYALYQLCTNLWPAPIRSDVADLMQAYLNEGYLPVDAEIVSGRVNANGPVSYRARRFYLELALRRGNADAVLVLISTGESLDCAPISDLSGESIRSLYDLVQATFLGSPETLSKINAAVSAQAMRVVIDASTVSLPVAAPSVDSKRRAGL